MKPFNPRLFRPIEYLANTPVVSEQGAPENSYPAFGLGVTVQGSVQVAREERIEPDGQIITRVVGQIYLRSDPSYLNGGMGVRTDDAFQSDGLLYQATGPHKPSAWSGATIVLWAVDVVAIL